MLTDAQVQVLEAVNDYCDIHNRLDVDPESASLPDALLDTGLTTTEITQALADLESLGLVTGVSVPWPSASTRSSFSD